MLRIMLQKNPVFDCSPGVCDTLAPFTYVTKKLQSTPLTT